MNRILYQNRCQCSEEILIKKKINRKKSRYCLCTTCPCDLCKAYQTALPYDLPTLRWYDETAKCETCEKYNKKRRGPTPLQYPNTDSSEVISRTFQMKYQKNLSLTAKLILNNFKKKYIYYAIDDILYSLKSNPTERDNLLAVLYSPILSLQNNFSVNFFNIWIEEVFIDELSKSNKFLKNDSETSKECNYITIKLFYKPRLPIKKKESLW